jgi:LPXTG-motif cell wall-anchored protein
VAGNVVTCAGAGVIGANIVQVGAQQNNGASDPNVSGTVTAHAGGGEEINVTILGGATVVIDAVIVKGGDGYNKYINPAVLPPALAPPQHYISPFVGDGNVPRISHWFICYHLTDPLPTGTLQVTKQVLFPDGVPVTPLPTSFTALVDCNDTDPAHQDVTINFNLGGGRATTPDLVGIPIGTVCTVVEQTGNAPVVSYNPVGANSPGVTITEGAGVVVNIVNDFSSVPVQRGTLHFEKVLVSVPGVTPPPTFTVEVACDDGTRGPVTLPGTGGPGTPDLSVRTLSVCALVEDISSLPGGWTLTYAVNGGPPSATAPLVPIRDTSTVTVTITNDASAVEPPLPTTTTAPTTTLAPTTSIAGGGGVLPPTGGDHTTAAVAGALLLLGVAVLVASRRRPLGG